MLVGRVYTARHPNHRSNLRGCSLMRTRFTGRVHMPAIFSKQIFSEKYIRYIFTAKLSSRAHPAVATAASTAQVLDLTVAGALTSVMEGVNVVFHVASFGMRCVPARFIIALLRSFLRRLSECSAVWMAVYTGVGTELVCRLPWPETHGMLKLLIFIFHFIVVLRCWTEPECMQLTLGGLKPC